MTLSEFPEPEPLPGRQPEPSGRRHLWIILGGVLALILFGGSATYLLMTAGHPGTTATPPRTYTPPDGDTPIDPPSVDPGADPSGSAGATPGHGATPTPGRTAATTPPPGGLGVPATYHVGDNLCASVDYSAMPSPGSFGGDHIDRSGYTDHTCTGTYGPSGSVRVWIDAYLFRDSAAAAANFANDRTGTDHVGGVGRDAVGSVPTAGGYLLIAVDGNLEFKIRLYRTGGAAGSLRQTAIDTATRTLPKLHG